MQGLSPAPIAQLETIRLQIEKKKTFSGLKPYTEFFRKSMCNLSGTLLKIRHEPCIAVIQGSCLNLESSREILFNNISIFFKRAVKRIAKIKIVINCVYHCLQIFYNN